MTDGNRSPAGSGGGATRRTFIGGATASAVAASVAEASAARRRRRRRRRTTRRADVIVVGAGLAGLAAADKLVSAGRSVVVLEARKRVGGRVLSSSIRGSRLAIEHGAEALTEPSRHGAMAAFSSDVGLEPYARPRAGQSIQRRDGRPQAYDPNASRDNDLLSLLGAAPAMLQFDRMLQAVPAASPWTAEGAATLDSLTLDTWLRQNTLTPDGRFLFDYLVESLLAVSARDVSVLFVLASLARLHVGSLSDARNMQRASLAMGSYALPGGAERVCLRHAKRLGLKKRVFLGSPVRRIDQGRRSVTVVSDRLTVKGKHVIVAVPPPSILPIRFEPALPGERVALQQRFPLGSVIKCHAVYDKPFWRDDGLNGESIGDGSPVRFTFDATPPAGRPGVLAGFITGRAARAWVQQPAAARREAVLRGFAGLFGTRAHRVTDYRDLAWAEEPWTRGGFGGFLLPGALVDLGMLVNRPFGRVHWAGTETATEWTGAMEGAVLSGIARAEEVLGAL